MVSEFTQELKNLIGEKTRDMHTVLPGRVLSFDPDKCEAVVLPHGKYRKPDGTAMDFPQISSVPVYFPQGAGQTAIIAWPVKPGDECLLLFAEQTLETWKSGAASNTDLRFDLQNAVAIVGLFSKANPLVREACDTNSIIIRSAGAVNIASDSTVSVNAPVINLN